MDPSCPKTEKPAPKQRELFHRLLTQLDVDNDRAADKYEKLRRGLISYFQRHAPAEAEALADRTIDRVCTKVAHGAEITVLLSTYAGGVAYYVLLEYLKSLPRYEPPIVRDIEQLENETNCMRKCLSRYPKHFDLLLKYLKLGTDERPRLAQQMKLTIEGLRTRVARSRRKLRECLHRCLARVEESKII